jgi:chromosome segregation ATPase
MMDEPIIKFGKALKKIDSLEEELTMYKKTVGESSDAIISLEKEKDGYRKSAFELQKEVFRLCGVSKEKEELQTRLSTLNAEIEGNGGYKDMLKGFQFKIESLESKFSTLLKASEGMEKALSLIISDDEDLKNIMPYPRKEAKQALADFRAVKKNSKKD